jgi:signal transduction histidine kinase
VSVQAGEGRVDDVDFREWLIFCGLSTLGTALITAVESTGGLPSIAAAIAIIVVVQLVFWFVARPSVAGVHTDNRRSWIFIAVALVGFTLAASLSQWATFALFALTPEVFLLLTPGPAAAVIVALNLAPLVVRLLVEPFTAANLVQQFGEAAFSIMFSLFFAERIRSVLRETQARQRLIDELHEREAEVAALSAARGAEVERTRIAREMHDTLAQGFTSIVTLGHAVRGELDADPAAARRHIELITATAQENLAESRRIISALSPARLADDSLPQALGRVVAGFTAETDVEAKLEVRGTAHAAPPATEVVALRIVQEALANARKHAHADHVAVTIEYAPDAVVVEIRDDGTGFDTATPTAGFGLKGMHSRVLESGGTLDIISKSKPGAGTTVRASLPTGGTS